MEPSLRYRLTRHGLTAAQFKALSDTHAVCAICHCHDESLVIDHDHHTGQIRGLLCNPCNRAIGMLGDDAEVVQAAADYLRGVF